MKKRILLPIMAAMLYLASSAQTTDFMVPKPVVFPAGYVAKLDVVYTKVNGWDGRADLYLNPNATKPTPVVINIHGGGWKSGTKESQGGFNTFFKAGFAVANMEYRLSGQAKAPAAVEDTRSMLVYLIKNAKELNIDVNKIVIMGGSAGGHLALMGGLLGNDHRFDTNCLGVENIKVAAIIDKYGVTDIWEWTFGPESKSSSPKLWLGENVKNEAFIKSVSPIYYVNKNSPPIFIVHGDSDPIVPYQQSVDLYKKLQKFGVKSQFITVAGGSHGKFDNEKNNEINKSIIEFLKGINLFD
ncbi:alpha/beta hydrolase [Flavobacterium cellulosilyticum]|uniref:Alpha/beta hydrolase n=1 Tax=Flavobacterium cellulosilyticum TaxID=2541731 RepID=A0A4V2YZU8_9FLAO|nr:alpha/beta hydrolase [Flavobacterium cellulosilyticum]TDD98537.1 alpha/beta hydrolase [Flavobacterium cellulosilyticum]